jgi:hypothetical protein
MRKHIFFTGMFSLALAFVLTAAGCDMFNGTTEPTRYTATYYFYEGAEPTSETVESGGIAMEQTMIGEIPLQG